MRSLSIGAALLLAGCSFAPTAPAGAIPLEPVPAIYADWWKSIETCSGRAGDFSRVTWMIYPDRDEVRPSRLTFVDWRRHAIYLARGVTMSAPVIRFAMLRYLLPGANVLPPAYAESCAALI